MHTLDALIYSTFMENAACVDYRVSLMENAELKKSYQPRNFEKVEKKMEYFLTSGNQVFLATNMRLIRESNTKHPLIKKSY